jgi:hypothetical protein
MRSHLDRMLVRYYYSASYFHFLWPAVAIVPFWGLLEGGGGKINPEYTPVYSLEWNLCSPAIARTRA